MNKYKSLAMNTVIFAIGSFGSKILVLFLTRLYTSNISPEDSNTKELLEITLNFLLPIFTLSISSATMRYGLDKEYNKKQVFTGSFIVCTGGLFLLFIVSPVFRLVSFLSYTDGYLFLLLLYVCASAFRDLCSQFVRAKQLLKLYSFDGIITTLTLFLFNVIFISKLQLGVKGFLFACILSDSLSAIFLFVAGGLFKYLEMKSFDRELTRVMLKFALPVIPTTIMWTITGFSDRLFIRYMESDTVELGAAAAGIYGYASKVPNLILMVSTIFYQAWNMSAITENNSKDKSEFYRTIYNAYQAMLYIATAYLIAFVKPVTSIFVVSGTFEEYSDVYLYTPILAISVLLISLNQFLSSIYTATCRTQNSAWTSLSACVANIILNIILIPKMGIQGAAIATLASYLICYIIRIFDTRRLIYFKVRHFDFIINMLVLIGMSYAVIESPRFKIFYLVCGVIFVTSYNFEPIMMTVKKLLKRH